MTLDSVFISPLIANTLFSPSTQRIKETGLIQALLTNPGKGIN